jgi:hypothetical protein
MVRIYCESLALKQINNPEAKDTISFSLKSMIDFYSNMENIMYM